MSGRGGLIRAGKAAFEPRARLLKLIGAELISDDVLAITELVKNAHDADASSARIEFRQAHDPTGTIVVRDDGNGMALDDLLQRWMQPAGTLKSQRRHQRTPSGRRVLGEKGVGRFAADKLASRLELISRSRLSSREVRAVFDWDAFDSQEARLSDIKAVWEVRRAREIDGHGTILRLSGLRSRWTERMFRRLSARLARLRPPFDGMSNGFEIWIESDEFPDYSGEVRAQFLDRAPYSIAATFDGQDSISVQISDSPRQKQLWNGAGPLSCGPVQLRLFGFDLESQALSQLGPPMAVRGWLKEWSGISLYRDGFRVWPYGEPHDDWLRLDQRRVNNPTVRLSNNQVVGFVEIGRDTNPELVDQTNREGLIHNKAYEDLRRLIHFVLQVLESDRQARRHAPARNGSASVLAIGRFDVGPSALLDKVVALHSKDRKGRQLIGLLKAQLEEDRRRHDRLVRGYVELAALGQSALDFSAKTQPLVDELKELCIMLRRQANGNGIGPSLLAMQGAVEALSTRLLPLQTIDVASGHRVGRTDVCAELEVFERAVRPILAQRQVVFDVNIQAKRALLVSMRPSSFHRVLHILFANAMDWLHRADRPKVVVTVDDLNDACEVVFRDNGSGISANIVDRIFEPEVSGREGGRGMGLTIARQLLVQYRATIEVIGRGGRRGAAFRLTIPARRRRTKGY